MSTTTTETTLARYRRELAALPDDALTSPEAAARAGVSPGRVRQWVAHRRVPSTLALDQRWIRVADLAAMRRHPDGVRLDRQPRKASGQP